jgi:hypothetical protein
MQRRISYVEKLPNKRVIADGGITAGKIGTAAITRGNVTFGVVKPISEKPGIGTATPEDRDNVYYNSGTGALTGIDRSGDEFQFADPVAQASASDALTSAGSRNRIFFQTEAPTNPINTYNLVAGDTWFDINADYKLSKWTGSAWTDAPLGDAAFANISVTKLIAGNITAGEYIQAGLNNDARIILAPDSGTSGGYSWDAGLSIYSGASTKSFYADMSGNLTITGATIKSTSSTSASRISITSSSFQIFEYSSGADKKLVNFSTSTGALYFLNDSLQFDYSNLITGSGASQILASQTDIYYRAVENDGTFISGSTNGYIRQRTEKTGPSFSSFPCGPDQYFQSYEIIPATIPDFYRPPGIILTNNLFEYGSAAADGTDPGEGKAKHAVHIQGQVGNHFTISSTVYAVKSLRNTYVLPSTVSTFTAHSDGVVDGEILLQYTP